MKTNRHIALTTAILAIAAPVASARPVTDPPVKPAAPQVAPAADHATMAAHRDQISNAQWQRASQTPQAPLTVDAPRDTGRFPVLIVALVLGVTFGILLLQLVGKEVLPSRRKRYAI